MSKLMKWKIRAAKKRKKERKKEEDFWKITPYDPNYFTKAEINQAVKEQNMPDFWKEDKMLPTSPYTTRLAIAVMNGKKVEVQNLLDRNADVNLISRGELPIIIATGKRIMHNQEDSDEIVKMLIDKGADVKKSQEYGDTALHLAVLAHKQERGSPGLVEVPIIDNKKVIQMLIEAGADILVAGSFVFKSDNPSQTIADLKKV